jgi:hypothetical protein
MSKTNHIPHTWKEIEDQVREAILCQLSILQHFGPHDEKLGQLYLGIDPDLLDPSEVERTAEEKSQILSSIPLERHNLHRLARNAYSYAYQLEGWERAMPDDYYEIACGVMNGFPQADMHGNPSPLSSINDFSLRRMLDTFLARWQLHDEGITTGLSVRELALLSNMTVPAVRTSLSKEGFKLDLNPDRTNTGRGDDKGATLSVDDAHLWLSRRRSFTPNGSRKGEAPDAVIARIFGNAEYTFDHALRQAIIALRTDAASLAAEVNVPVDWIDGLAKGEMAEIDIPALRALARLLKIAEPEFVGRAVQQLIRIEEASPV